MAPENESRTLPAEPVTVKPGRTVGALEVWKYLLVYLKSMDILQIFSELQANMAHGAAVNPTPQSTCAVSIPGSPIGTRKLDIQSCCPSILVHESRNVTVRLNTRFDSLPSRESRQK